ncbi:hypothetical protein [Singulisphaera sp. PoT]|uniref:hypothetical protein n=1 Tax=Singulisphaera sp. PoT TaxID=3411797 RepID=UPI003BF5AB28
MGRIGRSLAAGVLLALGAGCGEELGPVSFKTTRVRGVVSVGGEPVKGGFIEVTPILGTVGNLRTAPIGPDGRFDIDRVPVGKNAIGIMYAPIAPRLLSTFHPLGTPIHRTIRDGESAELKLDLLTEMLRDRRSQGEGS